MSWLLSLNTNLFDHRTGIASVGFVGFPSVGKVLLFILQPIVYHTYIMQSTLMSKLTGTHSEASEIDFTTLTTIPGTVKVHGAPIQILDLREYMSIHCS
jgi:ribosome-interacting GTPase 1